MSSAAELSDSSSTKGGRKGKINPADSRSKKKQQKQGKGKAKDDDSDKDPTEADEEVCYLVILGLT